MHVLTKKHLIYISLAFLGYFIYFLFILNPPLFLIKNYREFFTDIYFFKSYFDFPGNPSEYISRFLTQLFNIPAIASLVVTFILWTIYWLGYFSIKKEKRNLITPFLPILVLMIMHNDYGHSMKFDVDVLFILLSLLVYSRTCKESDSLGSLIYPVLLAFLLFSNGPITALLFSLLAVASVFVLKKKPVHLPVILIETLMVCLLFRYMFSLSLHDFRQEIEDILRVNSNWYLPFILYASVLVSFIFSYYYNNIQLFINAGNLELPNRKNSIITTGILIFSVCIIFLTFSHEQKMELSVQHEALSKNWNKALEYSRKCNLTDKNVAYYTNESLYQTGQIWDELFQYNQAFGSEGLFASEITNYSEIAPNQEICLQLGALSMSVVWGTEATNVYGANPFILKNLTRAYLAEGSIKEAQKMLNLLNHTLFTSEWVSQYQKFVDDTSLIKNNAELNRYRSAQLPAAIVSAKSAQLNLYLLSRTSSTNKMAYDYLLISTLLDNKINDFATCLSGLSVFGYHAIPKLYFEGLLYYSLYSQQSPIDIEKFTFDRNIIRQFEAFRSEYAGLKNNPLEARKKLSVKYGNTYWYYILFQSPLSDDERNDVSNRMAF